ncbi:hypothetical protein [Streptomyces griseoflavus]|uniref:hypothetical protein n=1 Tax=Streptomyces griseoflavus TaxID=35619 RepID=UPI003D725DA3
MPPPRRNGDRAAMRASVAATAARPVPDGPLGVDRAARPPEAMAVRAAGVVVRARRPGALLP